jgi:hypothetical protein
MRQVAKYSVCHEFDKTNLQRFNIQNICNYMVYGYLSIVELKNVLVDPIYFPSL